MQTVLSSSTVRSEAQRPTRSNARPSFEWGVLIAAAAFVGGTYLDAWAHVHQLPESFFTPWHGIIYASFGAAALLLTLQWRAGRRRGAPTWRALPHGYGLSMIGVLIFFAAGVGDLGWHELLGIENDIEALYSPPHLLLAVGGGLIATGPLRSAWNRTDDCLSGRWRAVISVTLLLGLLTFFTSEMHPLVHPWAGQRFQPKLIEVTALGLPPPAEGGTTTTELAETLGIGSVILQAALLVAVALLLVRRWGTKLPLGWITCVLGVTTVGLSIFHRTLWSIPIAGAAGLVGDGVFRWLRPSTREPTRLRIFSTVLPVELFALYFIGLAAMEGIWWSAHVWLGAIAFSGLTGWMLSYLVVPPQGPDREPHSEHA